MRYGYFSALQRAENSSIHVGAGVGAPVVGFQCSSASRKFLNPPSGCSRSSAICHFSALQRAENSSMCGAWSMMRVILNFSALQRAENSSIVPALSDARGRIEISVLFSEPKIPQSSSNPLLVRPGASNFSALQRAENSSIKWW